MIDKGNYFNIYSMAQNNIVQMNEIDRYIAWINLMQSNMERKKWPYFLSSMTSIIQNLKTWKMYIIFYHNHIVVIKADTRG